jgi:hypothetical protein
MLTYRFFLSLLRFFSMGIVPDDGGGAPAADPTPNAGNDAPADEEYGGALTPEPQPEADKPYDLSASLNKVLDSVSETPGQPRDEMGRFAPVAAKPEAAPAPANPQAAAPTPTPAPKTGDDLTPPEGMSARAQERWSQLTERVKAIPELERRATEAATALESVRSMVSESGLAPQEFSEMLGMARLYKSTSPQEMRAAMQQLDGLRADLAMRLGVDAPGVDLLASHPDLKQKVEGMLLSRDDALEIARLRQGNQQAQAITTEQREIQQFQQTVQFAAAKLETTLAARAGTPGHEAKVAYIAKHFQNPANLQAFVKTYQPQQWEAVLLTMYEAYNPQPAAPQTPTPQPLRPGAVRAGAPVHNGPVTAESAVSAAFDRLGLGL